MRTVHNFAIQSQNASQMPTINLFDFDGVIADPIEEGLFKMPQTPHDVEFMSKMCRRHDLDLSQETFESARYICMQAAMYDACIPTKPGPCFEMLAEGTYYIITARSDRFAVRRMHDFLDECAPRLPIKTLHLDHQAKGAAIKVLLDRHPSTRYRFFDDREKHVTSARMLCNSRLDVFHVDNDIRGIYEEAESFYRTTILELAL